jgi:chondroitin 4-sulfotransferase 11
MAIFTKLAGALTEITSAKIHQGKITFMNLARDFRLFVPESQIGPTRRALPRYSMIVVRHPFKRLLSAYQDKIERVKGREYYYKMYGKKIVKNFRKKDQMKKSGTDMSLPDWYLMALSANREFLKEKSGVRREIAIQDPSGIQTNEEKGRTTVARFYVPRERGSEKKLLLKPAPETPTFLEFCKYLMTIDPRNMDEHWRPQSLDCSPCHHKFDLFLKVETLNEDRRAVFKVLGYENTTSVEYKELEETWKAWSNRSAKVHDEDFYFSQLSESLINNLYSLYELDFELFGYSADKYFDMVKK